MIPSAARTLRIRPFKRSLINRSPAEFTATLWGSIPARIAEPPSPEYAGDEPLLASMEIKPVAAETFNTELPLSQMCRLPAASIAILRGNHNGVDVAGPRS